MSQKRALITGITGQDGSYLAESLLSKGYEVHGIIRRSSSFNTGRLDHLYRDPHERGSRLFLHYGDLIDSSVLSKIMREVAPEEVYHLGAQSHVRVSFDMPEYTGNVTALGTTRLLEAIREEGVPARFYQASSSEMFGTNPDVPTSGEPLPGLTLRRRQGVRVLMAVNYREAYGLFTLTDPFNPRERTSRETFVTRITRGSPGYLREVDVIISVGSTPEEIGSRGRLCRGHVADDASRRTDDYVIATGEAHP